MKIAIIGDMIIDRYVYGTAERLSPEAPVPIVKQTHVIESAGGAGNLNNNLLSLNIKTDAFYDGNSQCIKTRVFCDGHYMTRIDDERTANGLEMLDYIRSIDFSPYEYVIISDYNKGVCQYAKQMIEHINSYGCKVIVDPKQHKSAYEGAWLVKPNYKEFLQFGFNEYNGNIIVTTGAGSVMAYIDGKEYIIDTEHVEISDVTGAGDCFLAAFVYGLTKRYDYKKCLEIATRAASESVKHAGTYVLKPEDVEQKIVFTNGCFDILHRGHIEYLETSKKLGNKLIVGLNSDKSVKRLKGSERPIHNQNDRAIALEALRFVDEVHIFDEDTPYELIKRLQPDIITKGGDYKAEDVVGNDLAEVIILPYVENYSTTNIVSKLK